MGVTTSSSKASSRPKRGPRHSEAKPKNLSLFGILALLFAFSACSSSSTSNQTPADSFELIPLRSLQTTSASGLRGTIDVYNIESSKVTSKDLIFQGGSVFSPNFSLEKGDRYRLIVIFYYDALPIAYLDEYIVLSAEDAQNFTLDGQEVVFDPADSLDVSESLLASINTDVASGLLPDLDADDDGYSNDAERRGGSNAFDSSDVPTGPTFSNVQITYSNDGNDITITATVSDGNLISEVTPTFTTANYLTQGGIVETELSGDELNKERTFTLSFNPQYAPLGELDLSLTATNRLDLSSEEIVTLDIEDNGENVGPVIVFDSLTDGDVVNGDYTIEISAYDRDSVSDIVLINPSPESVPNTANSADRFIGVWQTTDFENDDFVLRAEATDSFGATTEARITVTVQNGSDGAGPSFQLTASSSGSSSQTINYNDGEPLYGLVNLTINASDISGVSTLSLTNAQDLGCGPVDYSECPLLDVTSTDFTVGQSETTFTFDATRFEDDQQVELKFRATDTKGYVRKRTFVLTVKNSPDINNFTASPDFAQNGADVQFSWSSDRADSIKIFDTEGVEMEPCIYSYSEIDAEGIDEPCTPDTKLTKSGTYTLVAYYTAQTGATNPSFSTSAEVTVQVDTDGDGDPEGNDCDDNDATLNENTIRYADKDDDGYGSLTDTVIQCEATADYFLTSELAANPNLEGLDDCNDEDNYQTPHTDWYTDADGDTYLPTIYEIATQCEQPSGYIRNDHASEGVDCDDSDANTYPNAFERLDGKDNNCDGEESSNDVSDFLDMGLNVPSFHNSYGDNQFYWFVAENAGDLSAHQVRGIGDFNGDGYEDFAITSRKANGLYNGGYDEDGAVYIYFGPLSNHTDDEFSSPGNHSYFNVGNADWVILGRENQSLSTITGGDFNNDGYSDLAIGAPITTHDSQAERGALYVIFGTDAEYTGTMSITEFEDGGSYDHGEALAFYGDDKYDNLGTSVASGDIDGDLNDDIIVGAPGYDSSATNDWGKAYVIWGDSSLDSTCSAYCEFSIHDSSNVSGASSGSAYSLDITYLEGGSNGDEFGTVVAFVPDLNGTGIGTGEISISDPTVDTNRGAVYLFFGDTLSTSGTRVSSTTKSSYDFQITGEDSGDRLGSPYNESDVIDEVGIPITASDIDNDEKGDLVIGAPNAGSGDGKVYVILGSKIDLSIDGGSTSLNASDSNSSNSGSSSERLGVSVAICDDIGEGSTNKEVLFSAPYANEGGSSEGAAYLYSGENAEYDTMEQIAIFVGKSGTGRFGNSLTCIDLDKSSTSETPTYDDFFIGEYKDSTQSDNRGGAGYILKNSY